MIALLRGAFATYQPLVIKWLVLLLLVTISASGMGFWYFSNRVDSLLKDQGVLSQKTSQMENDIKAAQKWQQDIEKSYNDLRAANAQVDARTRQVETRVKTLRTSSPSARRYLDEPIPVDVLSGMSDNQP